MTTPTARRRNDTLRRPLLRIEYFLRRSNPRISTDARSLLRDGYLVLPNLFSPQAVTEMIAALPDPEECESSPEGTGTQSRYEADRIEGLEPFFAHDRVNQIIREVLGPQAHRLRAVAQFRAPSDDTSSFDQHFHIDTWLPRYKAFLYLTDVDAAAGPLRYVPGSVRGRWRRGAERDIRRYYPDVSTYVDDEDAKYVGCFWPHEVRSIAQKLGREPRALVGKAGSVVLFDARGLHATSTRTKPRTILYTYWIKGGLHT
jgi:hypothetical protein